MRQECCKYKIKRGDKVMVITGREKGKSGEAIRVDRERGRVVIDGLNMRKKTIKPRSTEEKGSIVDKESPIHISNVKIICSKCGPTRVSIQVDKKEKKRVCRKCGEVL